MAKDKGVKPKKVKPSTGSRPGILDRLTTLVMLAFVVAQL